jgi:lantibiotic modifying enzyme
VQPSKERSLETANAIARHLCDAAFEHDGRCSWLGAAPRDDPSANDFALAWRTVGPDLYGGSSGIALFLAEVAVRSGDEAVRRAAVGGIRHALSRLASTTADSRFDFYTGPIGVAYSALRVERLLGMPDVAAQALDVLSDLATGDVEPRQLDVLDGEAGGPRIGLARLRALELDASEANRRDAEAAVSTAKKALREGRLDPDIDFSLGRGCAGVAEFLLRAGDVLADEEARDIALAIAATGAARYPGSPETWPCGLARGSSPGLMTGLAGIGYFYLRLADPAIPSLR